MSSIRVPKIELPNTTILYVILYHGFEGLSVIIVTVYESKARGRGQLSFDNADVAEVTIQSATWFPGNKEKSTAGISYPEEI